MVQSNQLTTKIPNYSPSNIGIGQQNDSTMYIHTPTDPSADDEDTEPDNRLIHTKDREKYMHQQTQVEKS